MLAALKFQSGNMGSAFTSYSARLVREHDRDAFLRCLFVPPPQREALLALYALNIELAQVKEKTREEMIGHIRLSWWQENIEALYEGKPPNGQPVLDALAPLIRNGQ